MFLYLGIRNNLVKANERNSFADTRIVTFLFGKEHGYRRTKYEKFFFWTTFLTVNDVACYAQGSSWAQTGVAAVVSGHAFTWNALTILVSEI